MKKLIMLLLVLSSCAKTETKPECETNKTGTMTVSNSSLNPYDLYINDVLKVRIVGSQITGKITVPQGNNTKFYVKQVSGFILFPTEKQNILNVISCTDYTWQIP